MQMIGAVRRGRILLLGLLLGVSGCDWLSGSESGTRVSPFLNDLRISRLSTLCDVSFTVSFRYDDPQRDMDRLIVEFFNATGPVTRRESVIWQAGGALSFQAGDRATFSYQFPCGESVPTGNWTVTVQVEDEKNHQSNTLSGTITLLSN